MGSGIEGPLGPNFGSYESGNNAFEAFYQNCQTILLLITQSETNQTTWSFTLDRVTAILKEGNELLQKYPRGPYNTIFHILQKIVRYIECIQTIVQKIIYLENEVNHTPFPQNELFEAELTLLLRSTQQTLSDDAIQIQHLAKELLNFLRN